MTIDHKHILLFPEKLVSRSEALRRTACPLPKEPGVYAWYFKSVPRSVPTEFCHTHNGLTLLYIGISPKASPNNGRPPSKQRLFHRIRYHMRGNAEGSTLRLSLGCLLSEDLGIRLTCVGSGKRMTFKDGERILSEWLEKNAFVAWVVHEKPWELEEELFNCISLPLNLDKNKAHAFHPTLSKLRSEAKELARCGL
jgi:hypothetical protein